MGKERKANWAEMMGEAVREPEFSHSYGGEDYFVFPFRCLRLSGAEDVVNVIVSRNTVDQFDIRAGHGWRLGERCALTTTGPGWAISL